MFQPLIKTFIFVSLLACTLSIRKDEHIKDIKQVKEVDQLKSYKNGSIVLFFEYNNRVTKRIEQKLIKVNRDLSAYGFKLRKLDCRKFVSLKECRHVEEPLVFVFKRGEFRMYDEQDLDSRDLAINQILFFMANANHEKMMDGQDMLQVQEFVEINTGYLNVVVGSFRDKDSEYLRRFLETVMDLGKDKVAFLLISGNRFDQSLYNKRGVFLRFYHSLTAPASGKQVPFRDISSEAHTKAALKGKVIMLNIGEEFKIHKKNLEEAQRKKDDAPRIHAEMVAKEKEKAMKKLKKQMAEEEKRRRGGAAKQVKASTPSRPEPTLKSHVKDGLSEVAKDALSLFWEWNHLPRETPYLLTENQLREAISNFGNKKNGILLVMFFMPWDPTYQMFEAHYNTLGDKYNKAVVSNVGIVRLDCSEWYTACNEYKFETYPTLIVFKAGVEKPFEYTGALDIEEIAQHINFWNDEYLPQLTDMRQLEELVKMMTKVFFAGIFANDSSVIDNRQTDFEKVAFKFYGKLRMAITVVKDKEITFEGKTYKLPIVIAGNAGDQKGRIEFIEEFDLTTLTAWINDQRRGHAEELTYKTFPHLLRIGKPFLISFQNRDKDLSSLTIFSKRFADLITVWIDEDSEIGKYIMDSYKISKSGSKIVILDKVKNNVYEYKEGKKTIGNVSKWVERVLEDPDTYSTHTLTEFKEVVNEGYDFLKLEDEARGNSTKEVKKKKDEKGDDVKPGDLDAQWDLYNKAIGIEKKNQEYEDANNVYKMYKKLKYRPDIEHDEL